MYVSVNINFILILGVDMADVNSVSNYGWEEDQTHPESVDVIAPKIVEILHRHSIKRVCDVGSGDGATCGIMKSTIEKVVGIELDASGVKFAQKKYPEIIFYNLGVQHDPAPVIKDHGKFEAVVSTEVVEHLFSPHLLPQFAANLIDENGILIISTPYHGYIKNLALSIFNKWDFHHTALWHGGHVKFWSKKTLTQLLEDNGFTVVEFHGVGRLPYLWKSMVLVAKAKS